MRWIVVCLMLVAAIACYAIGSVKGMVIFILLGGFFELAFWIGLLKPKQRKSEIAP